jgi:hypothetical protein
MAVVINRREFFLGWFVQNRPAPVEVEVMEVFSASYGPSAFLVHHASESARNAFGEWLRAHNGFPITCRSRTGTAFDGRIFRVRMCFGRGLILTHAPITIHVKDRVSIN